MKVRMYDVTFWFVLFMFMCLLNMLTSCANTKKTTQTHTVKSDTATRVVQASRSDTASSTRNVAAQDITFDVYYAAPTQHDTLLLASDRKTGIPTQPFDFLPDHSRIIRISGHIGAVTDSMAHSSSSKDTASIKAVQIAHIDNSVKTAESSWRWPLWLTIACIVAGLVVLLLIIKKCTSWL